MRRLIASLIAAGLMAVPLAAQATNCEQAGISRILDNSPILERGETVHEEINFEIRGSFLWVRLGNDGDVVSTEIPEDAVSVSVCGDGSVKFSAPTVETQPPATTTEEVKVVDDLYHDWQIRGYHVFPE